MKGCGECAVDVIYYEEGRDIQIELEDRAGPHLISGDAGRLSPERVHHMLLTTGCSSNVDISPGGLRA